MPRAARTMLIALAPMLAVLPLSGALAAQAQIACRNAQAEVTCTAAGCAINTDAFTPMAVSWDGSSLTVCAYSGCSSARPDLRRTRGPLLILHANVEGAEGGATLVYNRKDKIATLLWGSFALPLSCGEG